MKRVFLVIMACFGLLARGTPLVPVVEIEEDVYAFTNADGGPAPTWCRGSTCLVRAGEHLFASGLEMVPNALPLNNRRWILFERQARGWKRVNVDTEGRTLEPFPMAVFPDGRVFLSVNPTLGQDPEPTGGPSRPDVLQFKADDATIPPDSLLPVWQGKPQFREHSYRSIAADGAAKELIFFQNVGYTHAEWNFRDRYDQWSAQGQLTWPWGGEYEKPEPVRLCYPIVAVRDRAVYFFGGGDIIEPNHAWRDFKSPLVTTGLGSKHPLTGKQWDYVFRRLFYTWTPNITKKPFAQWIEIANRDKTDGQILPYDLYVSPDGDVHLLWTERAIDTRLRAIFFPAAKQSQTMNYAVVHEGKVIRQQTLEGSMEDKPGIIGSSPRFQVTPDSRLFVIYYASGINPDGKRVSEDRVLEIRRDGSASLPARVPLEKPFVGSFFTATERAGSPPSRTLEMLGERMGAPYTISYARVRLY